MVPPAFTLVALLVLTSCRSAVGPPLVVEAPVLFPEPLRVGSSGSLTSAGTMALAVLVMLPAPVTVPVTVKVKLPVAGRVAIVTPAPCRAATVTLAAAGQTAPLTGVPHETPVMFKPATAGSVTTVLLASLGPSLVTTTV